MSAQEKHQNNATVVPVLMYHHVTPAGGVLNCTPKNFEAQMAFLANHGYMTLTSQQFADFLQGEAVPEKSVVITFDDGYLDNYVYAHPILKKYNLNAHMFLVTAWVHDEVARPSIDGSRAYPFCPPHEECKQRLNHGRIDDVIVRWDEVKIMLEQKTFEFHSHSHTHTRWDKQLNQEGKLAAILHEMEQTKEAFQEHLGEVSEHFCWPQGYYEPDYVQIAQEQGFNYLYTTDSNGFNVPVVQLESMGERLGAADGRKDLAVDQKDLARDESVLADEHESQADGREILIYRNWVGNLGWMRFAFKLWMLRHPRIGSRYKKLSQKGRLRKAEKLNANQALS